MVKARRTRKRTDAQRKPKKRAARMPRRLTTLDPPAVAYAKLLADPCNAALVQPVFPGGDSGFLFRAESFSSWNITAGSTSGVVHWTPGYVNTTNTEILSTEAANGAAGVTMKVENVAPGKSFLASNARAARCIAACLKVTYAGAESQRAGRVHYGHTSSGMLDNGQTVTADSVAQTLQHYSRTPAETIELRWYPGIGDFEFNDPSEAAGAILRDRKTALTVAWAGLPPATPLTFHFTAIYEWRPAIGQGVGNNALGKSTSRNTFDDVLDALIRTGEKFVTHAGSALGTRLASDVSGMFGIMPARPFSRRMLAMR